MSAHDLSRNIFELQPLEKRRLLTTALITPGTNTLSILGTTSAENITVNRTSGGRITVSGVVETFAIGNTVSTQVNNILIQASGGNDTIILTNNVRFPSNNLGIPAAIAGNNGNDNITGGPGNDVINGNDGDDTIDGGIGNDGIFGGAHVDTTNYSFRGTALKVTLNSANPGLAGEKDGELIIAEQDDVQTEEVLGGGGNDTFIGSAGQDFMSGGGGNDSITGNGGNDELIASSGQDKLFGNDGNDYLHAQNSDVDTVNGGSNSDGSADFDAATVDAGDVGARGPAAASADEEFPPSGSDLDSDYGNVENLIGRARENRPAEWVGVEASAIDTLGRAYFVGTAQGASPDGAGYGYDFAIVRFTEDGALDTSYNGGTGEVRIDFTLLDGQGTGYGNAMDFVNGIAIDDQNRIVVVGQHFAVQGDSGSVFAVARLLPGGQLDASFNSAAGANGAGRQTMDIIGSQGSGYGDNAVDAAFDTDDKIVIAGSYDDGSGSDFAVARLLDDGTIDNTFSSDGQTTLDVGGGYSSDAATSVTIQDFDIDDVNSPRIVVGGDCDDLFTVVRFLNNGALDSSFADDGVSQSNFGGSHELNDLAVNSANQIVAVGNVSASIVTFDAIDEPGAVQPGQQDALLVLYSPDGNTVTPVDQPPTVGDYISYDSVYVDSLDRMVVAGEMAGDFVVARYLEDLTFDSTFADGLVQVDFTDVVEANYFDSPLAVRTLFSGKIVASGLSYPDSEGSPSLVAVRFVSDFEPDEETPSNDEGVIEDIETFVDYDDLRQFPLPFALKVHFKHMSEVAKFYVLSQPDADGVARLNVPAGKDNVVNISDVTTGGGSSDIAVNIDNVVLYFDPADTKRIEIYTNDGNDTITVARKLDILVLIDGGEGNDNITGGTGQEIMLGGAGNDNLNGAHGNDIMIGGTGADVILGSPKEDLIVTGTTAYDGDAEALAAIAAEWAQKKNVDNRIANLRNGGGLNGSVLLRGSSFGAGATVFDDAAVDIINAQGAKDWIFAHTIGSNVDQILGGVGGKIVDLI